MYKYYYCIYLPFIYMHASLKMLHLYINMAGDHTIIYIFISITIISIYIYPLYMHASLAKLHSHSSMAGDHIIYLTSSGSRNLFPDNNPGNFTNRLPTPIILDNNVEYEVGLVSILYPDQYYAIQAESEKFNIRVYTYQKKIGKTLLTVKIHKDILAGNMKKIVKLVNENILEYMKIHFFDIFPHLFEKEDKIFRWNEDERRVEILSKKADSDLNVTDDIKSITMQLNPGLADLLGFSTHSHYNIYSQRRPKSVTKSSMPPSPRCGVDYIYLYTDIIQPSNFGGQLVNILDCFSLQNGGNKGIHNSIYKPLNTTFIDQISIMVRDQKARPIHFIEDSTILCVIHVRPR